MDLFEKILGSRRGQAMILTQPAPEADAFLQRLRSGSDDHYRRQNVIRLNSEKARRFLAAEFESMADKHYQMVSQYDLIDNEQRDIVAQVRTLMDEREGLLLEQCDKRFGSPATDEGLRLIGQEPVALRKKHKRKI